MRTFIIAVVVISLRSDSGRDHRRSDSGRDHQRRDSGRDHDDDALWIRLREQNQNCRLKPGRVRQDLTFGQEVLNELEVLLVHSERGENVVFVLLIDEGKYCCQQRGDGKPLVE